MKRSAAEIIREYRPLPGHRSVHGVTYDGRQVWFATGDRLNAIDPDSGKTMRSLRRRRACRNGLRRRSTCSRSPKSGIQKIDPARPAGCSPPSPRPAAAATPAWPGPKGRSGWATIAPARSTRSIRRRERSSARIESNRFVTGVTWVDGELWHGTWEGEESDVRRIDPQTGEVLESLEMPPGTGVSGLESDGGDRFFCGGGKSGRIRVVRRPK